MVHSITLALVSASVVVMALGGVCKDPNAMKNNGVVHFECRFDGDLFEDGVGKAWCDAQAINEATWRGDGHTYCQISGEAVRAGNLAGNEADKPKNGTRAGNFMKACDERLSKDGNNVRNYVDGKANEQAVSSVSCAAMEGFIAQIFGPQYLNGSCEACTVQAGAASSGIPVQTAASWAVWLAGAGCCSDDDFAADCDKMCQMQQTLKDTTCAMLENYSGGNTGTCPALATTPPCVPFVMQVGDDAACEECSSWPCTWKPCSDGGKEVCSSN